MKTFPILAAAIGAAFVSTATPAAACAPPPPGWVPPTPAQVRSNAAANAPDIVYGRIERQQEGPPALRIYHVYKGQRALGSAMAVTSTWEFPVPVCAGMMMAPPPKPIGTYGVFMTQSWSAEPILVPPTEVQSMIAEGLIRSAQAR